MLGVAEHSQLREKAAAQEKRADWLSGACGGCVSPYPYYWISNEEHGEIGGKQ